MSNEEFQTIVLKKLDSLENGLNEIKVKLDAVCEQTAVLTEFKTDTEYQFADIKDTLHLFCIRRLKQKKNCFL